jgi:hypothetical protein
MNLALVRVHRKPRSARRPSLLKELANQRLHNFTNKIVAVETALRYQKVYHVKSGRAQTMLIVVFQREPAFIASDTLLTEIVRQPARDPSKTKVFHTKQISQVAKYRRV